MPDIHDLIVAHMEREAQRLRERDEALALAPRSLRRVTGATVVFSVRLDPEEVRALEERALDAGLKPTVLARNLIRCGLMSFVGEQVPAAIDRVEAAIAELRAAIGPVRTL